MTFQSKSLWLGAGALMLALAVGGAATLSAQNTNPPPPPLGRGMGFGGPGMGGPGAPLGMFLGRAAERLGLTDAQQAQIKSIAESHKNDMMALMKQIGDARHALLLAQMNGQTDDQIRQLFAQVAQAESNAAVAETHIIAEVMQVLTPDQQVQVKQFAQNPPRFGGRRGGK
jgi:Spy/CpxP family protein refolding chaperone